MQNNNNNNNNKPEFSQAEYAKQYNKLHYKNLAVRITEENRNIIAEYCNEMNISQAKFLTAAAKYCIRNSIDIDELLSYL